MYTKTRQLPRWEHIQAFTQKAFALRIRKTDVAKGAWITCELPA